MNRWIEVRITNAHADQMVKEDLSPDFVEKFIRGEKYTDIRFGPLNLHTPEIKAINLALEFLHGIRPISAKITSRPF